MKFIKRNLSLLEIGMFVANKIARALKLFHIDKTV